MTTAVREPAATSAVPPPRARRLAPVDTRPYLGPIPDCEPPFDDERHRLRALSALAVPAESLAAPAAPARLLDAAPAAVAGGRLRLEAASVTGHSAPQAGPHNPPVRASRQDAPQAGPLALLRRPSTLPASVRDAGVPGYALDSDSGVRHTAAADLPPAERHGRMFGRAIVEVLCGTRNIDQLRPHCAPEIFAGLEDQPMIHGAGLPRLTSVRVCEPADGVAEVATVFRRGDRCRAMAFRMQGLDGRWRVTELQLG